MIALTDPSRGVFLRDLYFPRYPQLFPHKFVDDNVIYSSDIATETLNEAFKKSETVFNWFIQNDMIVNADKFQAKKSKETVKWRVNKQ